MAIFADKLDAVLNKVTVYRLVVYVLSALAAIGIGAALMGRLYSSPTGMVVSLFLLLASAYLTDLAFGRMFRVPTNNQSWLITALILFLIIHPATSVVTGVTLVLAGAISSASKFLLTLNKKHFFNPAALAAAVLTLTGLQATTWWIGSAIFWPFTLVLGLLVVRKIRRFSLVLSFFGAALIFQAIQIILDHQVFAANMHSALVSSPLIFLGTIMLTEPATMPPRRNQQIIFGILVAVLYVTAWQFGSFAIYPEVALLIGNLYAYAVSPKFRLRLRLREIQRVSSRVSNYVFEADRKFSFLPGQYMEWTLADVPHDSRGNRRSFTIASSPTEEFVHLGVKFYEPASTFKAVLAELQPGDEVYGSQLGGNFTLPGNRARKLAFVAGGIGITPFRSMIKYLADTNQPCDVVLLYVVSDPHELAYMPELSDAAKVGVRVVPIVTGSGFTDPRVVVGTLSPQLISRLVPDYAERMFYLSGPNLMVDATKQYLHELNIKSSVIKTDHFSGY